MSSRRASSLPGAALIALAGLGMAGYGIIMLIYNFTSLLEVGLTAQQVGVTANEIRAFSPDLYEYISHVQTALGGTLIGLGIAITALAWYGIRGGQRWALWGVVLAAVSATVIGVPLHYPFGLATFGHLGLVYLDLLILLVGLVLSFRRS
jgi:hypothetical protein